MKKKIDKTIVDEAPKKELCFGQEKYKDGNGYDIGCEVVEGFGTYKHIADGFYRWICSCGYIGASRSCGWSISGMTEECPGCNKRILLLRSDVDDINKAMELYFSNERHSIEQIRKECKKLEEENMKLNAMLKEKIDDSKVIEIFKNNVKKSLDKEE